VTIDLSEWTAAATWAVALGTLFFLYWQTRTAQRLNSANAVMTLRERFDSRRMLVARRELSQHLLNHQHEDITNVEVATFFELVGALTHERVLDERLVWEAFGSWIAEYYWSLRHPVDLIDRARKDLKDPLVFHEFEWLYHRVQWLDRKELGLTHTAVVEESEARLDLLKLEALITVD
jgi:hypothetical protein